MNKHLHCAFISGQTLSLISLHENCKFFIAASYVPGKKRGHMIFPKRHFIESSFCWNPIFLNRSFAETKYCRNSFDRIVTWRIVELTKLHNTEHFSESLFSRTPFSRIVVQPNVIFTNRRLAERPFPETPFARTSFGRTLNRPPAYTFVQYSYCRAAIKLIGIDVLRFASVENMPH